MERLFEDLGVKNILLPSAEETRSLWMTKFGFSEMPQEEVGAQKLIHAYTWYHTDTTI